MRPNIWSRHSSLVPLGQGAVRLVTQPEPGHFHQQGTDSPVASLADALVPRAVAAIVGHGCQPRTGAQFFAVAKPALGEEFHHQDPGGDPADAAQLQ